MLPIKHPGDKTNTSFYSEIRKKTNIFRAWIQHPVLKNKRMHPSFYFALNDELMTFYYFTIIRLIYILASKR